MAPPFRAQHENGPSIRGRPPKAIAMPQGHLERDAVALGCSGFGRGGRCMGDEQWSAHATVVSPRVAVRCTTTTAET